ncbi:hypothetical protein Vretimale_18901 [Volvox reticuliferus]|uniref:Uncharacterized protein n=1 Tax=Volvox reticuliferus TaxID=1737510 RepID=A0A8J4CTF5_9CHLO|nr:hypothetical protein Vretifemale_17288 [Volvox reticuliferus]GIM16302.1 hypothetical protein Vretimale_18901 [Volvox reticuliferus]
MARHVMWRHVTLWGRPLLSTTIGWQPKPLSTQCGWGPTPPKLSPLPQRALRRSMTARVPVSSSPRTNAASASVSIAAICTAAPPPVEPTALRSSSGFKFWNSLRQLDAAGDDGGKRCASHTRTTWNSRNVLFLVNIMYLNTKHYSGQVYAGSLAQLDTEMQSFPLFANPPTPNPNPARTSRRVVRG